ncbi:MAG: RNA polymerase subunit sigma-70 [Deltaproteobacteria bacterium]|nr:RNA polymerase subunit sigma-70 [Deltaproteobacteria bacterium]
MHRGGREAGQADFVPAEREAPSRRGRRGSAEEGVTASAAREARAVAEAIAREGYGKLVALLASRSRDVAGAEDALAEAFAAALEDWPIKGVPRSPEAWLLTVARRRLVDRVRRARTAESAAGDLAWLAEELASVPEPEIPDERLALMFACAHPAIDAGIRAPLILQTVLGFDAATIASAFLTSPATMGQRLVRAKRKIREAGIPFEVPGGPELAPRLADVLDAIYATYAEGWLDPRGADARRRNLADDAIGLGRIVVALLPEEAEGLGLLSLMLHAQARRRARRDESGQYVPLAEQEPGDWDGALIDEAEALLLRASRLPGSGRFQLEAAVQSAHAARRRHGRSDWSAIFLLYEALFASTGSPVVAVNRAIALAELRGPEAGLAALDTVSSDRALDDYQPYWAARAELLARVGKTDDAARAFERAMGLERDPAVRRHLDRRRNTLQPAKPSETNAERRVESLMVEKET